MYILVCIPSHRQKRAKIEQNEGQKKTVVAIREASKVWPETDISRLDEKLRAGMEHRQHGQRLAWKLYKYPTRKASKWFTTDEKKPIEHSLFISVGCREGCRLCTCAFGNLVTN
jgi:hypothetical protein